MSQHPTSPDAPRPSAPAYGVLLASDDVSLRWQVELNTTTVSRPVAAVLTAAFLLLMIAVPALQVVAQWRAGKPLQELDLFAGPPTREHLHRFEDNLGRAAITKRTLAPHVQAVLTGVGGFGNTNVVLGRDGWLYFRKGTDYVLGRGILDPRRLADRAKAQLDAGEADPHPDPRAAILAFDRDCKAAGVRLVLLAVPDKAVLQPEGLRRGAAASQPAANNPDFARLLAELRAAGVEVFEPWPADRPPDGQIRFLRQDTHWTPAWMDEVAAALAAYVGPGLPAPASRPAINLDPPQAVRCVGDLVEMLELPAGQRLFPPEAATIRPVRVNGEPWTPDRAADVLLLGDSFTNIYTADEMGWGSAAGFGPHLAYHLQRPVDVIARNGAGSTVSRAELARRPDPLAGKRVIVWQFAQRDLTAEDWRPIPLSRPVLQPAAATASAPTPAGQVTLVGRLVSDPPVINLAATPYVNALAVFKFQVERVEAGTYAEPDVLVVTPVVLKRAVQPAGRLPAGARCRLTLSPETPPAVQTWQTLDATEGDDLLRDRWWAERVEPLAP